MRLSKTPKKEDRENREEDVAESCARIEARSERRPVKGSVEGREAEGIKGIWEENMKKKLNTEESAKGRRIVGDCRALEIVVARSPSS